MKKRGAPSLDGGAPGYPRNWVGRIRTATGQSGAEGGRPAQPRAPLAPPHPATTSGADGACTGAAQDAAPKRASFRFAPIKVDAAEAALLEAAANEVRINLVATTGGGGCYADTQDGRKTRQNVVAALKAHLKTAAGGEPDLKDPRPEERPQSGKSDFEYMSFAASPAEADAIVPAGGYREVRIVYEKHFTERGVQKSKPKCPMTAYLTREEDFLMTPSVQSDAFEAPDACKVHIEARIDTSFRVAVESPAAMQMQAACVAFAVQQGLPQEQAEEDVSGWTVSAGRALPNYEVSVARGQELKMAHGYRVKLTLEWGGDRAELDVGSLAVPIYIRTPTHMLLRSEGGAVVCEPPEEASWQEVRRRMRN